MGREIRRVPPNWQHPQNQRGDFHPMYDEDFANAAAEWKAGLAAWNPEEHNGSEYWELVSGPPEREYYRPAFTEAEATHFQIYETVSEGTPVSPVFSSRDELAEWLVSQGTSEAAAKAFAQSGFCFSMMVGPGGIKSNYETLTP